MNFDNTVTRWPMEHSPEHPLRRPDPQDGTGIILAVLIGLNLCVWLYTALRWFV